MLELSLKDVSAVLLVYAYIIIVFLIVEKAWKGDRSAGRKILHISMGNIVFFLWLIDHAWVAVAVAGSFIFFTLLITQRMQCYFLSRLTFADHGGILKKYYRKALTKLSLVSASDAGNEFGLVYYCISYTVLALLFFSQPVMIAAGILPLAYGDGLGGVIGKKFGRHKYRVFDSKSYEGSLAVFAGTVIAVFAGMVFYGIPVDEAVWKACLLGVAVSIVEAIVPGDLDNLAIPLSAVALFYLVSLW